MLDSFEIVNFTNQRMLNIILNEKAKEAEKNNIEMEIRIGEIHLEHIADLDMTTIFANLLDNALEAAEQAEGKRRIQVRADAFHDFTAVRIRNSMRSVHSKKPEDFKMDVGPRQESPPLGAEEKRTGKVHMGIGLESVRQALENYGGGMMTEAAEGEFIVNITIPGSD